MAAQLADDLFLMPTLDEPSTGLGEGPEGEPNLAPRPAGHGLAGLVDIDFDAALQMHALPPALLLSVYSLHVVPVTCLRMPQRPASPCRTRLCKKQRTPVLTLKSVVSPS